MKDQPFVTTLRKLFETDTNTRLTANAADGEGVVITYGFKTKPTIRSDVFTDPRPYFSRLTSAEENAITQTLKVWSAVADIKFVRSDTQDADLMFGKHDMPYKVNGYAGAFRYSLDPLKRSPADIWLDDDSFILTPLGRQTVIHEVAHSLGLKHPIIGKNGLKASEFGTTILAQNLIGANPYTGSLTKLGVIDTAAIQSIYGPAQKKLGANTHKVGSTHLVWDGGGNDTLSAAGAKAKAHLDLNDGSWNWIGKKATSILSDGQTWLGHFTEIENAVGSSHSDTIIGNEHDNIIQGGSGNDTITGGAGSDALIGGKGRDTFIFRNFGELGTLDRPDVIVDFGVGDRIDLRKLKANFLGMGPDDNILSGAKPAQVYYNTALNELRFDVGGDGSVDFVIRVGALTVDQVLM